MQSTEPIFRLITLTRSINRMYTQTQTHLNFQHPIYWIRNIFVKYSTTLQLTFKSIIELCHYEMRLQQRQQHHHVQKRERDIFVSHIHSQCHVISILKRDTGFSFHLSLYFSLISAAWRLVIIDSAHFLELRWRFEFIVLGNRIPCVSYKSFAHTHAQTQFDCKMKIGRFCSAPH